MRLRHAAGLLAALAFTACTEPATQRFASPADSLFGHLPVEMDGALAELDSIARNRWVDSVWTAWAREGAVPVVTTDTVVFFYRGNAVSVRWNGDFNGWGRVDSIPNTGTRLPMTDLWTLVLPLPTDARVDYKIVVNDSLWILDPANPAVQWGGAGPNSEVRMPGFVPSPFVGVEATTSGRIRGPFRMASAALGYDVEYQIYLPPGWRSDRRYPVLVTTDGQEYLDDRLGDLRRQADALISSGLVRPFIIVGVDPRDPDDHRRNRRMDELIGNGNYVRFITRELLDKVNRQFPLAAEPEQRALLGTSLGGLFTTDILANHPGVFGNYIIQSPAYWVRPVIFEQVDRARRTDALVWMSYGTLFDGTEDARRMEGLLRSHYGRFQVRVVNEGHSWGAWRHQLHEPLRLIFPNEPTASR